jgi:hypothetical protein
MTTVSSPNSPLVATPAVVLDPADDPMITPRPREQDAAQFSQLVDHRLIASGHNQPFNAPAEIALAVRTLHTTLNHQPR